MNGHNPFGQLSDAGVLFCVVGAAAAVAILVVAAMAWLGGVGF